MSRNSLLPLSRSVHLVLVHAIHLFFLIVLLIFSFPSSNSFFFPSLSLIFSLPFYVLPAVSPSSSRHPFYIITYSPLSPFPHISLPFRHPHPFIFLLYGGASTLRLSRSAVLVLVHAIHVVLPHSCPHHLFIIKLIFFLINFFPLFP